MNQEDICAAWQIFFQLGRIVEDVCLYPYLWEDFLKIELKLP